ncbi:Legumaturain [Operophtera brumata]|uniref:Legumaturain n=1 Tax=Operophtera brumata TaxID=104452 RepID=A0A0L7L5I4_OPEBR|nr:Legumaturain [Operophtera brumata]
MATNCTHCGTILKIDSAPIKACAKGDLGANLLYAAGQASKQVGFDEVPYVLINGNKCELDNANNAFMKSVCAAFRNPPPPCNT